MRKFLTTLAFVAFASAASAQMQGLETLTLDGRVVVVPSAISFDHYTAMCDKYVHRVEQKAECKLDMQAQKLFWDQFVQSMKYASLAKITGKPEEEKYGLDRARTFLKLLDQKEKTIKAAWPEILRPH